jgi:O-antigen ligase
MLTRIRLLVIWGAASLTLLASTGLIEDEVFAQPTTLKYALTVVAPLALFLAAWLDEPLQLFGALTIVAAPAATATASFSSVRISILVPLLVADFMLIAVRPCVRGRPSHLGMAALCALPLLLVPVADSSKSRPFVLSLVLLIAVGYATSHLARTKNGLRLIVIAIVVGALFQALVGIWNAETGHTLNLYSTAGTSEYAKNYSYVFGGLIRPSGMLPDPISLGNVLAISIPAAIALVAYFQAWKTKLLVLLAACVVALGLVLSLDRTSWIAAVAGMFTTAAVAPSEVRNRLAPSIALGVIAAIVLALVVGGSATSTKLSSIVSPTNTQGVSADEKGEAQGEQDRLAYWHIAFADGFLQHPLTGVGIGQSGSLILAHSASNGFGVKAGTGQFANVASTYLQILAEGGVGAAILFVLLFRGLWKDLRRALWADPLLVAGLAGAAVALLICWVTDVVVYYEPVAACEGVLLGAIAGTAQRARNRSSLGDSS